MLVISQLLCLFACDNIVLILCEEVFLNISTFIIAAGNISDSFFAKVVDSLIFINEMLNEEGYDKIMDECMLFVFKLRCIMNDNLAGSCTACFIRIFNVIFIAVLTESFTKC
jgi:hypothetical protein